MFPRILKINTIACRFMLRRPKEGGLGFCLRIPTGVQLILLWTGPYGRRLRIEYYLDIPDYSREEKARLEQDLLSIYVRGKAVINGRMLWEMLEREWGEVH